MPLRVAFIGFGTIGRGVLRLLSPADGIDVIGALVRDAAQQAPVPLFTNLRQLLSLRPDVVVEAAGHEALRRHGPEVLRAGFPLVLLSVGALAEPATECALREAAEQGNTHMVVASGAIGALDAIAAAAVGGLDQVTHTTRKPARALLPAEEARNLSAPRELFRGTAREGALKFPENINVAAAVSLAGIGLDRTEVCVVADPSLERNTHEVFARGTFGELRLTMAGIPTDDNPRTGRLVAMSVVHTLRRFRTGLVIG